MVEGILKEEFQAMRDEIVRSYEAKGMRASGKFADETVAIIEKNGNSTKATIVSPKYAYQLENGRRPGIAPPSDVIEKWIKDKNISFDSSKISLSSLAFLIARKIAREGTKYYKEGGTQLISGIVTTERIQKIIDRVKVFEIDSFVTFAINQLKPK